MKSVVVCLCVALGAFVLVAGCGDEAVDDGGALLSQSAVSAGSASSAPSSQGAGSSSVASASSQSQTVSSTSSVSFGPLRIVFVEQFEGTIPPVGWEDKRGIFPKSGTGYSCDTNGQADDGQGIAFSGGDPGQTNWITSPDISSHQPVAIACWYRTGLSYDNTPLGFTVSASTNGLAWSVVGVVNSALAVMQKAGPYPLPVGVKYVRFSHVKILNVNVYMDTAMLFAE